MSDTDDTDEKPRGNTKSRGRGWCFTVNNYDTEAHNTILEHCKASCDKYIVAKEVGKNGTKHLQGYMYFKNAISFNTVKKALPKAHIEKAKGNWKQNYEYCSKDGDFVTNIITESNEAIEDAIMLNELYGNIVWRPWQQQVIDIIEGPIDNRAIHWFWEETGSVGKSFLAKYVSLKYNAIIASGKQNDVFNQVLEWVKKNGRRPRVVIVDCPRSAIEYIHYGCIEAVKNGMLYSGKYEGGRCIFYTPHVIVFANELPQKKKMSADRWCIWEINEE